MNTPNDPTERICCKCHGRGRVKIHEHQHVDLIVRPLCGLSQKAILIFGPIAGNLTWPSLGSVEDGYLVMAQHGASYLFQPEGPLGVEYVTEKLRLEEEERAGIDAAHAIGLATGRPIFHEAPVEAR